jgi:hypothetical protein
MNKADQHTHITTVSLSTGPRQVRSCTQYNIHSGGFLLLLLVTL